VIAEIDGVEDQVAFESAAEVTVAWAHRNGADPGSSDVLARTLKTLTLPKGDYYAWVAAESLIAKALRAQLIADHGANPKWMRAAGYWRRGAVAVHDTFND
jgi:NADPH-dependent ferric siderophore reductase